MSNAYQIFSGNQKRKKHKQTNERREKWNALSEISVRSIFCMDSIHTLSEWLFSNWLFHILGLICLSYCSEIRRLFENVVSCSFVIRHQLTSTNTHTKTTIQKNKQTKSGLLSNLSSSQSNSTFFNPICNECRCSFQLLFCLAFFIIARCCFTLLSDLLL